MRYRLEYFGNWDWERCLDNNFKFDGFCWYRLVNENIIGIFAPVIFLVGRNLCISHSARDVGTYLDIVRVYRFGHLCWKSMGRIIIDCPGSLVSFDIL